MEKQAAKKQTAYVLVHESIAGLKPAVYHVDFCMRVGEQAFISRSLPLNGAEGDATKV